MGVDNDRIVALLKAGVCDDEIALRLGASLLDILGKRGEAASAPSKLGRRTWPRLRDLRDDSARPASDA